MWPSLDIPRGPESLVLKESVVVEVVVCNVVGEGRDVEVLLPLLDPGRRHVFG